MKVNLKEHINAYQNYPIDGVTYLDINPVYRDPMLTTHLVNDCYDILCNIDGTRKHMWYTQYDSIAVVESRGFIIGSMLAARLNKGLVLLRSKPGRLPGETAIVKHTLEYGDSQMEVQKGEGKVLIFDDVIATGGTSQAAVDVLTEAGYTPVSALFLLQLNYLNPKVDIPYESVIHYNTQP